jgi:hypothetical protein
LFIQANTSTGALLALKAFRWGAGSTLTTATISADVLGAVSFYGNSGQSAISLTTFGAITQYAGATINSSASQSWTSGARGTDLNFRTTNQNTNTDSLVLTLGSGGAFLYTNTNFRGVVESVYDMGNALATPTINVTSGTVFKMVLTGTTTINSLGNVSAGSNATLILKQDGTGGRTLSSTMLFAGASKTLSTAASATDIISVFYDGTNYYASLIKGFA